MRKSILSLSLAGMAMAFMPGVALAHAKLVSSSPAANAAVPAAKAKSINLTFNEKVIPSTMKTELVMTGMPGMKDHAPMKVAVASTMGKDGSRGHIELGVRGDPAEVACAMAEIRAEIARRGHPFRETLG